MCVLLSFLVMLSTCRDGGIRAVFAKGRYSDPSDQVPACSKAVQSSRPVFHLQGLYGKHRIERAFYAVCTMCLTCDLAHRKTRISLPRCFASYLRLRAMGIIVLTCAFEHFQYPLLQVTSELIADPMML